MHPHLAFRRLALFFAAYVFSVILTDEATPVEKRAVIILAAVNSLPDDGSAQAIFIYPNTYSEQVIISRTGQVTSTTNTASYTENVVTITHSESASAAGSDEPTATLQVLKDDFALYNVNVKNTIRDSYQETLLFEQGNQFYGFYYIEGAFGFIWGQHAFAFFEQCTIASVGAGAVTADGPDSTTDSLFVINESNLTVSSAATSSLAGEVYLGRPWTEFAQFGPGWEIWSTATPDTEDVLFAEYDSSGPGAAGARASFSEKLTSNPYTAADVLGSSWTTWVDSAYA
ncbi:carbohydrate esterase family 8 protein [Mycena maculata]|uniref:pectinesterase n=1 Tax=Mycena maculata TaxID=230809 RepID=A0AAD7NUN6_9AGAR|nr:carbohydrate esterase family 8 protein [Mycena maculata]